MEHAEKAAWIEARMETLSRESYIAPFLPGTVFPKGGLTSGREERYSDDIF